MQTMFKLLRILYELVKSEYHPLNSIELSSKNLKSNYKYLSKLNHNISIAPVLKSNAYGHGLKQIASVLDALNPPFFCVDSLFEAYELLRFNVKTRILIMGYVDPENLKIKKLPFSYAIWSLDQAAAVSKYQQGAGVHVFVDTGMNREGVALNQLEWFLRELKQLMGLRVEGLMSHLAQSTKNDPNTKLQLKNYREALNLCLKTGINPKWRHLAASGGLLNGYALGTNMARVGRAIYGIELNDTKNLKGVLSLKTQIIQIKKIKKGFKIGYDGTFEAAKDITIAVLPIGYNDGVDRRLSNKGVVFVGGVKCAILGRISMNITTIDITEIPKPFLGQEVIIYSDDRTKPNSIEASAKICGTLPHDILVHLASSTRRVII